MKMAELMELIEKRREQSKIPPEQFANRVGIRGATFYRQMTGTRTISLPTLQLYAKYFRDQGDVEMLRALGAYALGLSSDEVVITPSK